MKKRIHILSLILLLILALSLLASCTDEHEHKFSGEWTEITPASPEADGSESNVCTECNEKVVRPIPAHEHAFAGEWTVITEATTEEEGCETNVCAVCKTEITREIPIHEHTFSNEWKTTLVPTEEKSGKEENVCDVCAEKVTRTLKYCKTHTYSTDWTQTQRPTYKNDGAETNVCVSCGGTVTRAIPKLEVVRVIITSMPTNTSYFTGEYFSPSGLKISAILSDGSLIDVTASCTTSTTAKLNESVTSIWYWYKDFQVNIPIKVSPAIYSSVNEAVNYEDGTLLCLQAYYVGSFTDEDGRIYNILKDTAENDVILLYGTDFKYTLGNRLLLYANVASDENGKYLEYSSKNASIASTLDFAGNFTFSDFGYETDHVAKSEEDIESILDGNLNRYDFIDLYGVFNITKENDGYVIEILGDKKIASARKTLKVCTENISGDALAALFTEGVTEATFEGKITALAVYVDEETAILEILTKDWIISKAQMALAEVAYAFYNQLPYVDYDQYNTRRNINPAPEDATEQQRIYLDCSSYVNAVYYNAFSENILPFPINKMSANTSNFMKYAKETADHVEVIGYYETRDYQTEEEQLAVLKELYAKLEVGDVIVYRKGDIATLEETSGHALIYVGGGKILHCMNTGSYEHVSSNPLDSYDQISTSSIGFESCYNLFESKGATRYLLKYVNFTILRPLNRELTLNEQTEARLSIPALTIEKLSDVNMYSAVSTGDEITYTISLENTGNERLDDVVVTEMVPLGAEYVESTEGFTCIDRTLYWEGSVEAGETVIISFTVRVTTATVGALIESDDGNVNGLKLNSITHTLSSISDEAIE